MEPSIKNNSRRRNITVSVRMTAAEKRRFDQKVEQSGLSRTDYFIACMDSKPIVRIGEDGQMDQLLREVNRIGVNINQIAKCMNQGMLYSGMMALKRMEEWFAQLLDLVQVLVDQVKV